MHAKGSREEQDSAKGSVINFERVPVVKGTTDVGFTEIKPLRDLPPNTRIIAKGAFFALAKMTNVGEHEH